MNYKKLFLFTLFLYFASLGFLVEHDIHKVFLGISSVMFSYGFVCIFLERKVSMIVLFVVMAMTLCQLCVTARGIVYQSEENSTEDLAGDIAYGFCNMKDNLLSAIEAVRMARQEGDYSGFDLNYRLLVVGVMIPILAVSILFRKPFISLPRKRKAK